MGLRWVWGKGGHAPDDRETGVLRASMLKVYRGGWSDTHVWVLSMVMVRAFAGGESGSQRGSGRKGLHCREDSFEASECRTAR